MHTITDLIIPLGFFAMAFGIVYISVNAHHKSKMAMIEAGMDPRDEDEKQREKNPDRVLKYAILLIMVPIGILVGRAAAPGFDISAKHGALIFAFMFGGLGMGIYYLIQKRRELNSSDKG